jgi:hypothetical protein
VPKELAQHYPKPFIEISLKQSDRTVAAAVSQETHQMVEEQFERLRQGLPKNKILTNYQSALELLARHNLTEADAKAKGQGANEAKDPFFDSLDDTIRAKSSEKDYTAFRYDENPFPYHLLDDDQRAALTMLSLPMVQQYIFVVIIVMAQLRMLSML